MAWLRGFVTVELTCVFFWVGANFLAMADFSKCRTELYGSVVGAVEGVGASQLDVAGDMWAVRRKWLGLVLRVLAYVREAL